MYDMWVGPGRKFEEAGQRLGENDLNFQKQHFTWVLQCGKIRETHHICERKRGWSLSSHGFHGRLKGEIFGNRTMSRREKINTLICIPYAGGKMNSVSRTTPSMSRKLVNV